MIELVVLLADILAQRSGYRDCNKVAKNMYTVCNFLKGSLGATVKLYPCDLCHGFKPCTTILGVQPFPGHA